MSDLEKYFTPLAIKAMQENDISLKKLGSRLILNDDLKKAFSFNRRGKKSIYPKWALDKAKANGISRQTLHCRVKLQGLSIREAVEIIPLKTQKDRLIHARSASDTTEYAQRSGGRQ